MWKKNWDGITHCLDDHVLLEKLSEKDLILLKKRVNNVLKKKLIIQFPEIESQDLYKRFVIWAFICSLQGL